MDLKEDVDADLNRIDRVEDSYEDEDVSGLIDGQEKVVSTIQRISGDQAPEGFVEEDSDDDDYDDFM